MAKKIALLGFSALLVANVAFAESTGSWVEVTNTDNGSFSIKKGTFRNAKSE